MLPQVLFKAELIKRKIMVNSLTEIILVGFTHGRLEQ